MRSRGSILGKEHFLLLRYFIFFPFLDISATCETLYLSGVDIYTSGAIVAGKGGLVDVSVFECVWDRMYSFFSLFGEGRIEEGEEGL